MDSISDATAGARPSLAQLCAESPSADALRASLASRWPLTFREYLRRDFARNEGGWKRKLAILAFRAKSYPALYGRSRLTRILGKVFARLATYVLLFEIPVEGVVIGPGLRLAHGFFGTLLHQNAILGEDVELFQYVMIGEAGGAPQYGSLVIGDRATIGLRVSILGRCRIGDDASVGAHALVVNQDVPDGGIVVAPRATPLW